MTDLRTYLADKLKADGYDGLCAPCCGCGVDDLAPCGVNPLECQPAYRVPCTEGDFYTTKNPEGR